MRIYAALVALTGLWGSVVRARPLYADCNSDGINKFVADDQSLCIFYKCTFGQSMQFSCAQGSRVLSYFTKGPIDPCVVRVKKNATSFCDRYNEMDDPIPGANKSNQCAQFRPCDARPGCTCIDQVAGYYCSCPPKARAAPTPAHAQVPKCNVDMCQNGGTCYRLNDNELCTCKPLYTGKFCETSACEDLSCNNGVRSNDSFGVSFCACQQCYTGQCCEYRFDNCIATCNECVGGANCTTPRLNKCKCNPCPTVTDYCLDTSRGVRKCLKPPDTAASEFTLMFEDNFSSPPYGLEVYVSAASNDDLPRSVTVDAPLMSYSRSDVIQPGEVKRFSLDVSLKHTESGKGNFGVRVREINSNLVNVYCINRAQYSADGWLALPDKVAGKAYIVTSYSPIIGASQFAIVAIHNNTVVTINLVASSEDIAGSGKNTSVVVNLNAWQTYQVKSATNDLTGTSIVSNNPIHVYSGEARGWVGPSRLNPDYDPNFPVGSKSRDNLILECTSIDTWGRTYAIVPLPRTNIGYAYTEEAARVVSYTDATCKLYATTDNAFHFTEFTIVVNASGNYYAQFYMNAAYNYFLSCDKPVMLVEITESSIPKGNNYNDPSFIYVPAIASYSNYYHFFPPVYSVTNSPYLFTYLRLIASETDYLGIEVNGEPVSVVAIETMKNWTQIYVPNGSPSADFPNLFGCIFRISSSNSTSVIHPAASVRFAAIVEGYDDRESYGISLGASIKPQNSSFSVAALQSGPVAATIL